MPAPIDYLTPSERQAYDAVTRDAADADASAPARAIADALTELACRRERDTNPAPAPARSDHDRAADIRRLLDAALEVGTTTQSVANLATALGVVDTLANTGTQADDLAARGLAAAQTALEASAERNRELERAITLVRAELIDLGPGAQLLAEGRLERLGAALELATGLVTSTPITAAGEIRDEARA